MELSRADMELSNADMELSNAEVSVGKSEARLAKITFALLTLPLGYGLALIILALRGRVALDKSEGAVKTDFSRRCF